MPALIDTEDRMLSSHPLSLPLSLLSHTVLNSQVPPWALAALLVGSETGPRGTGYPLLSVRLLGGALHGGELGFVQSGRMKLLMGEAGCS